MDRFCISRLLRERSPSVRQGSLARGSTSPGAAPATTSSTSRRTPASTGGRHTCQHTSCRSSAPLCTCRSHRGRRDPDRRRPRLVPMGLHLHQRAPLATRPQADEPREPPTPRSRAFVSRSLTETTRTPELPPERPGQRLARGTISEQGWMGAASASGLAGAGSLLDRHGQAGVILVAGDAAPGVPKESCPNAWIGGSWFPLADKAALCRAPRGTPPTRPVESWVEAAADSGFDPINCSCCKQVPSIVGRCRCR
jgi:hypothetical protein